MKETLVLSNLPFLGPGPCRKKKLLIGVPATEILTVSKTNTGRLSAEENFSDRSKNARSSSPILSVRNLADPPYALRIRWNSTSSTRICLPNYIGCSGLGEADQDLIGGWGDGTVYGSNYVVAGNVADGEGTPYGCVDGDEEPEIMPDVLLTSLEVLVAASK